MAELSQAQTDNMEGVEFSSSQTAVDDTPLLTEKEKQLLELYDRSETLQLEIALLKAKGVLTGM